MDWQLAITRNREALLQIVVALMASVGLRAGGTLTTLPNFLYRKALMILRQAESAVRRLIVIAAYDIELRGFSLAKTRHISPFAPPFAGRRGHEVTDEGQRRLSFNIIDPLKTFDQDTPDFTEIYADHMNTKNYEPVPAASLGHRILALNHALNSIPKLAKRLARWYEQRDFALKQNQPHRLSPIRPGPPPASRRAKCTEMDSVLNECHSLAQYARERPDSS
jgi:hypothetical protein